MLTPDVFPDDAVVNVFKSSVRFRIKKKKPVRLIRP